MAIALPPPIAPQQAAASELRAQASQRQESEQLVIDYQGTRIHVFGDLKVDPEVLRAAVTAAGNISDAVRSIGYLHYTAGYPASLVSYSVTGSDELHVRVVQGRIKDVSGPEALTAYFSDLRNRLPLTDAAIEADRGLADALSERAGEDYSLQLRPVSDTDIVLEIDDVSLRKQQTHALATFNNYGNRYAGPYLVMAGLRHSWSSGDEISLSGIGSVEGLGGSSYQPYYEGDAGWSRVTRYGVFGLEGRYATFQQQLQDLDLDGTLSTAAVTWLYPLYADFHQRLNLQSKFEHGNASIDAPPAAEASGPLDSLLALLGLAPSSGSQDKLLSEHYNSVELNLSHVARVPLGDRELELQLGLSARKGLGPSAAAGTLANLDYFLWKPSFGARYAISRNWSISTDGSFQFCNDRLPQLQQFVIGGPISLHAYEAGAAVGDRGDKLRLAIEWNGDKDSWAESHDIRTGVFVEYGSAALTDPAPGASSDSVDLADAGIKLGFTLGKWLYGSVAVARSIYSKGEEISPNRLAEQSVFFQLGTNY